MLKQITADAPNRISAIYHQADFQQGQWPGAVKRLQIQRPFLPEMTLVLQNKLNLKICRCPSAPDSQALILSGVSALTAKLPALKKF